jgi:hypothetical protein
VPSFLKVLKRKPISKFVTIFIHNRKKANENPFDCHRKKQKINEMLTVTT